MSVEPPTLEESRANSRAIHDEAAAALAIGTPEAMEKALSNIVSMARYEHDTIAAQDKVRNWPR